MYAILSREIPENLFSFCYSASADQPSWRFRYEPVISVELEENHKSQCSLTGYVPIANATEAWGKKDKGLQTVTPNIV